MAMETWAAPIAYLQVGREPSGKLAVKSVIRPDDILERNNISRSARRNVEWTPVQTI
ncbi:hypothetical protein VPNG_03045 [Cytospora leucostoma]|uniref:Uncharacterized protein n=1 Tax=Cytospora leucostoma TaxID=1230097 RepID=A0A423XGC0_9PEZI|nr:hypothetical protein VPNG_03045 [Cytospora leucostoma]